MSRSEPDDAILCDVCGTHGFYDPRDPWDRKEPKPTWRCEPCIGAVVAATDQRHGLYPHITFDNKEQQAAWDKAVKNLGYHYISIGTSINMDELRKRRFQ